MITLRPAVVTASTTASWRSLPSFIAARNRVRPRPMSAIASGSPAATTDPKAISSTIAAPRNPIPSGLVASWAW
jgi:hypothetical protein